MNHDFKKSAQKFSRRLALLESLVYSRRVWLPPFRGHWLSITEEHDAALMQQIIARGDDDSTWFEVQPPAHWARSHQRFVLRARFTVPEEYGENAALHLPLGISGDFSHPEALAYIDGEPLAACDRFHQEIMLPARWCDGRPHTLALHGWTGMSNMIGEAAEIYMQPCSVVEIDHALRDFIATARAAHRIAQQLHDDDPARGGLLNALDAAFALLDTREPIGGAPLRESTAQAHQTLRDGIARAGAPLDVDVIAAGHAHIDTAWLWTLDQTQNKVARTFHTALHLMEQFPDYTFTQSQPQLYEFLRQHHPDAFARIQAQVKAGRWEPIGGMWIESDCNVAGAESLARQFLLGRGYYREHFGADAESPILWLPDTFGFNAQLPQLMSQAGMRYFFSTKISWNQHNRFPYDSFWWQGIDGTRILTHFTPTPMEGYQDEPMTTYNATAHPEDPLLSWRHFQNKEQHNALMMVYGWGDGGGGPTREMLENIRELEAFAASPRTRHGTALSFFEKLEADAAEHLHTWRGELYLEIHRGTYTTQARNKRANRKSEFALHDAEFLAVYAAMLDESFVYPRDLLNDAWRLVCLNQFHDILPGSSIGEVYIDSQRQYAQVFDIAARVSDAALNVLAARVGGDVLLINPTGFAQDVLVLWPQALNAGETLRFADDSARRVFTQSDDSGTWIHAETLPPYSISGLVRAPITGALDEPVSVSQAHLENAYLRVEFDAAGDIVRLYDKQAARDVLPPNAKANVYEAYEDRPINWDAWDIDLTYTDRRTLAAPAAAVEVIDAGPLRGALRITRQILNSPYVQIISLDAHSRVLRFDVEIDWRERHTLLKAAFPVDVVAERATYEIQFGQMERPTHRSTSWDWARFEVAAQKWADLSEANYGVSLLNDCKYGHDAHENTLRLTLLRAPTDPDPQADAGLHSFSYALMPHAAPLGVETLRAAYALNDPARVINGGGVLDAQGDLPALVRVDAENIVIETVKRAEDDSGLIVRLYESQRARTSTAVHAAFPITEAWRVNVIEDEIAPLTPQDGVLHLTFKPFEIVTLKLR